MCSILTLALVILSALVGDRSDYNKERRDRYRNDPVYREKIKLEVNNRRIAKTWRSIVEPELRKDNPTKCKEYYYRHHEKRKAHQRGYYWKNVDKVIAYQREYGKKNREKVRARAIDYRRRNLKEIQAYDRERQKTPNRRRQSKEKFQRQKYKLSKARRNRIKEAKISFGNKCNQCGWGLWPEVLEFDHLVKLVRSGKVRHWSDKNDKVLKNPDRVRLVCPTCHRIKTALQKRQYPPSQNALGMRQQRNKVIELLGGCCAHCGYRECILGLEIDHIKPVLRKSSIWDGRVSITEAKINRHKYQLLCGNCHKLKSLIEISNLIPEAFWLDPKIGFMVE